MGILGILFIRIPNISTVSRKQRTTVAAIHIIDNRNLATKNK